MASRIQDAYKEIQDTVARAAKRAHREPQEVTVVAVSKTVGLDKVQEAIDAGILDFGENRTPEFNRKCEAFPQVRWHFIGTLQTNKVKDVVGRAHLIHSVDSLKLLRKIDMVADRMGVVQPVLLQVNVSGEESKHGFTPDEVRGVLKVAQGLMHQDVTQNFERESGAHPKLAHVCIQGFMTMAPIGPAEEARSVFCELSKLRDENADIHGDNIVLNELSMGMSGDYEVAVEEGATLVRVGRSLFA